MRFLWFLMTIILLTACSSKVPVNQYIENDISVSEMPPQTALSLPPEPDEAVPVLRLGPDAMTDVIFDRIPEWNDIAAFIYRQSKGEARLVVQAFDEPINIWETRMSSKYIPYMKNALYSCTFYLVSVGEEWDDGSRFIWYWLYPYRDSKNEFSRNYKYPLDEWRNDNVYIRQMNLIQDVLSGEGHDDGKLDSLIAGLAVMPFWRMKIQNKKRSIS